MSKAVMISIQPRWCELIAKGEKTVEVRKTRPKIDPSVKCYIYCTKGYVPPACKAYQKGWRGYVIGEFECTDFRWRNGVSFVVKEDGEATLKGTCLTKEEIYAYLGIKEGMSRYDKKTEFYCWSIDNLIIYDEPKELSEFYGWTDYDDSKNDKRPCSYCEHSAFDYSENCEYCSIDYDGEHCVHLQMKRPPQSWCYVEELK